MSEKTRKAVAAASTTLAACTEAMGFLPSDAKTPFKSDDAGPK